MIISLKRVSFLDDIYTMGVNDHKELIHSLISIKRFTKEQCTPYFTLITDITLNPYYLFVFTQNFVYISGRYSIFKPPSKNKRGNSVEQYNMEN